jgi:hypothetical protein
LASRGPSTRITTDTACRLIDPDQGEGRQAILRLSVRNANGTGWEHAVKRALQPIDGVLGVTASYKANLIGIAFDATKITPLALQQRIEALGYDVGLIP